MYSTRWQCIYRCTVTRGFRLMNIQSTRGKVLTATAALISLPERCQSVNRQQSLIFLGGAKQSKDGDDVGACEWWLVNSASVLTSRICKVWYLFSEKFIFALAWRLKFGHLGASGYKIYFSVYRVGCECSRCTARWRAFNTHAGQHQRVHFSILQLFLLTTYGNNRRH